MCHLDSTWGLEVVWGDENGWNETVVWKTEMKGRGGRKSSWPMLSPESTQQNPLDELNNQFEEIETNPIPPVVQLPEESG